MEITVFTHGDSTDINTWSNVPYMFTKALEKQGVKANRCDIALKNINLVARIYDKIRRLFYHDDYLFLRTRLYRFMVGRKIKRAVRKYSTADYNLFLTTSFDDKWSNIPNVLFFDWTYKMSKERYGKPLSKAERKYVKYENQIIERAHAVFPMFKKTYEEITRECSNKHIYHLNRNVVNILDDFDESQLDAIIEGRKHDILFIGRPAYIKGAKLLIEAFRILKKEFSGLRLHIVGMTEDDFSRKIPKGVTCWGYLRKNIEEERKKYYSLLKDCAIFCNPSSYWGGYSSTLEALYYGLPVVVHPYPDFVADFGSSLSFGEYSVDEDAEHLATTLRKVITSSEYSKLCHNAHDVVHDFTWTSYVSHFLATLKNI